MKHLMNSSSKFLSD